MEQWFRLWEITFNSYDFHEFKCDFYIWNPKVSLVKKSRLHKIKISYLWRLDPSNFYRSFIPISNHREKTPINILKSILRSTMFWPVRFSLILGRSRILTYNSSRALSIDPLRSRVIFTKLGPIEFHLASGRVTFCVYNCQRSPLIELYKSKIGFITNLNKDKRTCIRETSLRRCVHNH